MTNTSTAYDQGMIEGCESESFVVSYDEAPANAAEIAADREYSETETADYLAGFAAGAAQFRDEI